MTRTSHVSDRRRFVTRGGANWMVAGGLRWNVFDGFADRARIEEARHESQRARAQERVMESGAKLEARRAFSDLRASRQRIEVSRAASAMARESLRITKDRYEAGLTGVTDLLRTEVALLEAQLRELQRLDVRYVVLHSTPDPEKYALMRDQLREHPAFELQFTEHIEGEELALYLLKDRPAEERE